MDRGYLAAQGVVVDHADGVLGGIREFLADRLQHHLTLFDQGRGGELDPYVFDLYQPFLQRSAGSARQQVQPVTDTLRQLGEWADEAEDIAPALLARELGLNVWIYAPDRDRPYQLNPIPGARVIRWFRDQLAQHWMPLWLTNGPVPAGDTGPGDTGPGDAAPVGSDHAAGSGAGP